MTEAIARLRRGFGALTSYVGAVMGDHDYARYLEHHAAHHPGDAPCSEREYWRRRHAARDRDPRGACC